MIVAILIVYAVLVGGLLSVTQRPGRHRAAGLPRVKPSGTTPRRRADVTLAA